jgi:anti-sigma regulatory factor (Ser/Thr protein kinase)
MTAADRLCAAPAGRPTATLDRREPRAVPRVSVPAVACRSRRATIGAVPALRHFAQRTAVRWGVASEAGEALALVVSELVSNAVLHSGGSEVTMRLTLDLDGLTVEVKDSGQWRHHARDADPDGLHGRGLALVKAFSGWWLAYASATGTRVVARIPVPRAG